MAPPQETDVKRGGPCQIDQQDEIFAEGRDAVRSEAEFGDARGNSPQRHGVDQQGTDHKDNLQKIESIGRCARIPRGDGIEQKAKDDDGKTPLIWQERLCAPQG